MNSHISVGLFISFKAHISPLYFVTMAKNLKKKNRPSIKSHFRWCTGIEIAKFVWLMYHFLSHILTSNLNRIPIKWSICNESMTTRQKKIVSGSDKVWNNDGCAVYICLTKTRKKYLQVTWAFRYIYGRVHTKKIMANYCLCCCFFLSSIWTYSRD